MTDLTEKVLGLLRPTKWWEDAEEMVDRHLNDPDISLADHLLFVHERAKRFIFCDPLTEYGARLREYLNESFDYHHPGRSISETFWSTVGTAALFHDIGKPREEPKELRRTREIRGKEHSELGEEAVLEVLPEDYPDRDKIVKLVHYHDTTWAWWRNRNSGVPKTRTWRRLGSKVDPMEISYGLILIALHSMADTHGHRHSIDTVWFMEQMNERVFNLLGTPMPIPTNEELMEGVPVPSEKEKDDA